MTLEDVLEELVGEIYDEHDEINEEMVENEDGSLIVDGGMQLQELLEKCGIVNSYDTDTVGGWVAEMLEKVPEVNDSFDLEGYHFEVTEMDGFRVTKVKVTEIPKTEPPEKTGKPDKQEKTDQSEKADRSETTEKAVEPGKEATPAGEPAAVE